MQLAAVITTVGGEGRKSDESGIPSNKGRGEESPQKNLTERSFNMDQFMSP